MPFLCQVATTHFVHFCLKHVGFWLFFLLTQAGIPVEQSLSQVHASISMCWCRVYVESRAHLRREISVYVTIIRTNVFQVLDSCDAPPVERSSGVATSCSRVRNHGVVR